MNLQENIQRIKEVMGLINEGIPSKVIRRLNDLDKYIKSSYTWLNPKAFETDFTPHVITPEFTLAGRTLAITGRLKTLTRDEVAHLAKLHGAQVLDKFSGKVDLLIVGFEPGSKLAAAQRNGIALIDEKQFITIVS